MKNKKSFIAILFAVVLVFSLAFVGCNGNSNPNNDIPSEDSGWSPPY